MAQLISLARRNAGPPAAGIVALLLAVGLPACGGSSTGPGNGNGGGAASVTVTPAASTLEAVEATVNLSASGTSSQGNQVTDADMDWSSTDQAVATVDDLGNVTARGNGTAQVVAALPDGAAADTAQVTVDQVVVDTRIEPASAELPALGDTIRFTASPEDANGFLVEEVTIEWSTSDASVLSVDADGLATAVDTGEAQAVATPSEGPEARASVEVARPDPVVDAVNPDSLVEGTSATVTGQNFSAEASRNEVLVDGVQAAVTAASTTQIEFTVPQYACRPSRAADLVVRIEGDSSNVAGVTVSPDEAPVSLAVGERVLLEDPTDFCVQLGESGETQEYLVGVQSISDAVGPVSARLTLQTGGTAGAGSQASAASGAGRSLPSERSGGPGMGSAMVDPLSVPAGHSRLEARLRDWEREHLGPRISESIPARFGAGGPPVARTSQVPPVAAQIGSNPAEGDTVDLRVPDLNAQNACTNFTEIQAVIQKVGTHSLWLEDVDNPSGGFDASTIQAFSDQYDDFTHPTDSAYFGAPADIDGNDRVAIVVTQEVNKLGGTLGFVFAGDLFPRSGSGTTCSSSDEGEVTYTIAPDPNGAVNDSLFFSASELQPRYPGLIAHEVTHTIQFGRRFQADLQFPSTWMLEGQATLAEEVVGHAVTGRQTGQNYGLEVAFNTDDSDATDWYRDRFVDMAVYYGFETQSSRIESAPEECSWLSNRPEPWGGGPCLGSRAVYGVPSHLLRWINDHLGPDYPGGEQALQRDLTGNDAVGFDNVEEVTGESMASLLADWGAMLWTDDRVPGVPERLTDPSWNLVDIFQGLVSTARLQPESRSFIDFSDSFGVNAGSAAYYLVGGDSRPPVAMMARRPTGEALPSFMQMWVVRTQ